MFGLEPRVIFLIALVAIAVGAVAYAILFNSIDAERKTANRMARMNSGHDSAVKKKAALDRVNELNKRKKSVQESLKEIEEKQKKIHSDNVRIKDKIAQAGLSISMTQYYIYSIILGLFVTGAFLVVVSNNLLVLMLSLIHI